MLLKERKGDPAERAVDLKEMCAKTLIRVSVIVTGLTILAKWHSCSSCHPLPPSIPASFSFCSSQTTVHSKNLSSQHAQR